MSESQSATFPATRASARAARIFLRRVLPDQEEPEFTDVILLLVTELVTNAVIHARTSVRVQVAVHREQVRIDVQDDTPDPASAGARPWSRSTGAASCFSTGSRIGGASRQVPPGGPCGSR